MKIDNMGRIYADRLHEAGRYPVADPVIGEFKRILIGGVLAIDNLAGKWTGETRPPRKGEWYISGAIPATYQAPNDLTTPHAIARLVRLTAAVVITEHPLSAEPEKR